jgi:hypothetical protein
MKSHDQRLAEPLIDPAVLTAVALEFGVEQTLLQVRAIRPAPNYEVRLDRSRSRSGHQESRPHGSMPAICTKAERLRALSD